MPAPCMPAQVCAARKFRHDRRIRTMERAFADRAIAALEVDHRREAEIEADGADLARHQPGVFLGQSPARGGIDSRTAGTETRSSGRRLKPSRKRCTGPPSWSTQSSSGSRQPPHAGAEHSSTHLRARGEVAREQDHAADTASCCSQSRSCAVSVVPGNSDHQHLRVSPLRSSEPLVVAPLREYGRSGQGQIVVALNAVR
jgi:hypothetical protein